MMIIIRLVRFIFVGFRFFYLNKKNNISLGENTIIDYKTKIDIKKGILFCGKNCYLRSNPKGYHAGMPFPTSILIDADNASISIGNNCRINGCYIHAQKSIKIGNNCVIAAGTNIIDSNGHELCSEDRTKGRDNPKNIIIGNNVWIGLNCIILKGSIIGDNSVVAAGTVVKGTFPKNSLISNGVVETIR